MNDNAGLLVLTNPSPLHPRSRQPQTRSTRAMMTGVLSGTGADVSPEARFVSGHGLAACGLLVVPLGGEVVGGGELGGCWGGHDLTGGKLTGTVENPTKFGEAGSCGV